MRRLYAAATWWRDKVPIVIAGELRDAEERPIDTRRLSQSELMMNISSIICNSLLYLGNVYQLARLAGDQKTSRRVCRSVRYYMRPVEHVQYVPIDGQVGVQALSTLIGMRHAVLN